MNWQKLLSDSRNQPSIKKEQKQANYRSEFQRDFDRIVFSNAFRRLQGKTQVFPLPENDIIHNRLTHSLETSCVGRSLGHKVAFHLKNDFDHQLPENISEHDVGAIVASACLVHDLGNPPFGHNGEDIIQEYFKNKQNKLSTLTKQEKNDLQYFDGNALGLRLLNNKEDLNLTYATLASFVKYPISSENFDQKKSKNAYIGFKKFGVFASEIDFFRQISAQTGLQSANENHCQISFYRHPLNFLVESADDICYNIIDLEDAYRSGIINDEQITEQIGAFIKNKNSALSFSQLRSLAINNLVEQVAKVFLENYPTFLQQPHKTNQALLEKIDQADQFKQLKDFSLKTIYQKEIIIQKEIGSYSIINQLLDCFLEIIFNPDSIRSKKSKKLLPKQYHHLQDASDYQKIMAVVEFIAGMTDRYALKLYRMISAPSD